MNNNSFSILAVASRFGKLIGALLSIIGYFIFTGTLTGLINDFTSGYYSSMGGSQITDIVAEQIQLMSDVLGLIRAGAIVLFIFAMAAVLFSLLARDGIVASLVDGCFAVFSFIVSFNFNLPAELRGMDLSDYINRIMNLISSMGSYVVGIVVAIIVIFVIAVVNVRAIFPTDFIEIRIPTRPAYRPAYNPNVNAGFQQVNAQAPNMAYGQGAGYQHVNAQAPNAAYGQNAGYQHVNAQAPNAAYGQNAGYQHVNAQAPNAAYGQNAGYQQYAPNAQAQNPAYGQNPDYNQNNRV
ncbi:MAG: hypothetical protein EGR45_07310 [Ruminococcaceae bacterium]|nr:hypothetical protein [Oscillospiraceae bacterium]